MFPYLDIAGFRRRSPMMAAEVDYVETDSPGFVAQRIASRSSWINARLRKRYGNAGPTQQGAGTGGGIGLSGNSLPFGQTCPLVVATAGTPGMTLSGRPTLGSISLDLIITTAGALGAAVCKYSWDGGLTFTSGVTVTATLDLGFGVTAIFTPGTYPLNAEYTSATPVPEVILGWLVTFVTWDLYRRRGVNPADSGFENLKVEIETAEAELKEAADGQNGLIDLPVSEDTDSAVTTGGPLGDSQQSPYAWTTIEAAQGVQEDVFISQIRRGIR